MKIVSIIIKAIILYMTILFIVLFIGIIDTLAWKDILFSSMCILCMCFSCYNLLDENDLKILLFSDKFEKFLKK